jgi:hypothetical protein
MYIACQPRHLGRELIASGRESCIAMFFRVAVISWMLNLFASVETTASRVPEALHKRDIIFVKLLKYNNG